MKPPVLSQPHQQLLTVCFIYYIPSSGSVMVPRGLNFHSLKTNGVEPLFMHSLAIRMPSRRSLHSEIGSI